MTQAVAESFQRVTPPLPEGDGKEFPQGSFDGTRIDICCGQRFSVHKRVVRRPFSRRQRNGSLPFEIEQQALGDHVLQLPVGLCPVPGQTKPLGQIAPTGMDVLCDHPSDEGDVGPCDPPVSVYEFRLHAS